MTAEFINTSFAQRRKKENHQRIADARKAVEDLLIFETDPQDRQRLELLRAVIDDVLDAPK